MQSPSPQAFNHTLLPSLRHVRTLSFPFSFILYFLTSFLLSLHPPRPVYSRVPIWALETEPSRWSDRRQIFSVFRELTMRAERDEQKKKGKCKKDERDREQEGWGRKKKPKWMNANRCSSVSSMVILLSLCCRRHWRKPIFSHLTLQHVLIGQKEDPSWKACHHGYSISHSWLLVKPICFTITMSLKGKSTLNNLRNYLFSVKWP